MNYQAPQIEWKTEQETDGFCSYEANTATHKYRIYYSDTMKSWMCTYYRFSKPETKHKYLPTSQELKEWVETTHYPSALIKAGFKPASESLSDTLIEKLEQVKQWWRDDGENNAHRIIDDCIDIIKRHSDWISVDERLPNKDGKYLIYCVGNNELTKDRKELSIMRFNQKTKGGWFALSPLFKVIYWQQIQPPSEVQDD